jgi:phage FluMu gp28-like protein
MFNEAKHNGVDGILKRLINDKAMRPHDKYYFHGILLSDIKEFL